MTNDLLWGFENQNITSTVILDLSTAFDTIDHGILLTILHDYFGIQDTALNLLNNYLRTMILQGSSRQQTLKPQETQVWSTTGVIQWGQSFSPGTAHLLKIKLTTPLHRLHLLMTTPSTTISRQVTRNRNTKSKRPRENIHTSKTMNGYDVPEAKP